MQGTMIREFLSKLDHLPRRRMTELANCLSRIVPADKFYNFVQNLTSKLTQSTYVRLCEGPELLFPITKIVYLTHFQRVVS